jgi:cell division protein FtsB
MASGRGRKQRRRGPVWRALTVGDRPYVLVLLALLVVVAVMALGPLQVFTEAADRVDELERDRDRLHQEVEQLEERHRRLEDPEEVERLARSELGLVRPGEIPFVVVPPDRDEADEAPEDDPGDGLPWYRRLGHWLGDRLGGDD